MSILTTLQLLPLFGAIVVAVLPVGNAKLIKQTQFWSILVQKSIAE